jgi:hypothetical protein
VNYKTLSEPLQKFQKRFTQNGFEISINFAFFGDHIYEEITLQHFLLTLKQNEHMQALANIKTTCIIELLSYN